MQQKRASAGDIDETMSELATRVEPDGARVAEKARAERAEIPHQPRCYGIQVLVAGRRKCWRDRIGAQIRRAGYTTTTVDCAVDALTVLALGLPVDVLVTDTDLHGNLRSERLAVEARSLRPSLGIVIARDRSDDDLSDVPDALTMSAGAPDAAVTVREALAARV